MKRATPCRARGHILLTLLLLTVATTALALNWLPSVNGQMQRRLRQQEQFAVLREALIARAVNDDNRPGSLPCPAPNPEVNGTAPLLAGQNCPQRLDGVPWSTLKIRPPHDASHTPWYYLIAPGLQDSESSQPIHSDHPSGLVSALGALPVGNIAAVLIAPGPALASQQRPSVDPAAYSEVVLSQQSDGVHFALSGQSNDQLYLIHRDEILRPVERRVLRSVLRCLDEHARYSGGQMPWAAPLVSAQRVGQVACTFGRVPATQPVGSLTQLAQETAASLQQAAPGEARQAACSRAGNLLHSTKQALTPLLQLAGTCQGGMLSAEKAAPLVNALREELDSTGLANSAQRQQLLHMQDGFASGTGPAALLVELEAYCGSLLAQLGALQQRQDAASSQWAQCVSQPAPLINALSLLSPPGTTSAAARWPMVWGAAACDFLRDESSWWARNEWADMIFYRFAPVGVGSGEWPQIAGYGPVERLVIAAGAARSGQHRPGFDFGDYLEGGHAAAGAALFFRESVDGNDQIAF